MNLTQQTILRFSCINDTNSHFHIGTSKKPFFKSSEGDYWVVIRSDEKQFDENCTTEEIISNVMENLTPDQQISLRSR